MLSQLIYLVCLSLTLMSKVKEKTSAKKLALEYFDFYYASTFGQEWNQMRLALLTGRKYVALVNNYANRTQTINELKNQTALDLIEYSRKVREKTQNEGEHADQTHLIDLNIPKALKIFSFDTNNVTEFASPSSDETSLLSK
jgi:hypothetical protein